MFYQKRIILFPSRILVNSAYSLESNHISTLGTKLFSSESVDSSKKTKQNSKVKHHKVPTSGYIGKTRFDLLSPLFSKFLITFLESSGTTVRHLLDETVNAHDTIISNRGVISGTKRWKDIIIYSTHLLEGRDATNPGWLSTGKKTKWPKVLRHLRPLFIFIIDNVDNKELRAEVAEARRLMLTLFKLNRVCTANSTLGDHLVNIKQKVKLDPELVKDFQSFCNEYLKESRNRITLTDLQFTYFLGASNGPNRKPKLETSLEEAAVLRADEGLYGAFQELCSITGNNDFLVLFEKFSNKYLRIPSFTKNIVLRKITAISDKANKSRVIAICDFWTQSILAPLEQLILKVTSNLFSNKCCYYSHQDGWDEVLNFPEDIQPQLVSLDASSWTDNFPAVFQYFVIQALMGQRFADAWKALVVDCEWHVPFVKTPIRYGKGQGMGTKGSFAIAQLTDLIFIEYVFSKAYPNETNPYFMKVGDDLIIQDPDRVFPGWYEKIGVPINMSKSKFSVNNHTYLEFVSRNAWNGFDYSIISPSLISKFLRNDYYGVTLCNHITERHPNPPSYGEILDMKKEILESKANFDLDKYVLRRSKLTKIVSVLNLVSDQPVELDDADKFNPSIKELKLFCRNLVLLVLAEFSYQTKLYLEDLSAERMKEISSILTAEAQITINSTGIYQVKELFRSILENNLTFKESVILVKAMPILETINKNTEAGSNNISETIKCVSCFITNDTGVQLNPVFIDKYLSLLDRLKDTTQRHRTVGAGPLFGRMTKVSNTLEAYKLLNSIIVLDSDILDLNNNRYYLPSKKSEFIELPSHLVQGYSELLGTAGELSQIESMADEAPAGEV